MYAATEQRREKGGSGTTKRRTGSDGQNKKEWKQGEEAKPGAKRMMGRKWKSWVKREGRRHLATYLTCTLLDTYCIV